jgi:hypothetical protein
MPEPHQKLGKVLRSPDPNLVCYSYRAVTVLGKSATIETPSIISLSPDLAFIIG